MKQKCDQPDRIRYYFEREWLPLLIVTVTGIFYNVGMVAGPWFEGQMAQMLCDILGGKKAFSDMLVLALTYVAVIFAVQATRYAKRFYVRRFANNVSREMKHTLYCSLVQKSRTELASEQVGTLMTKAVADIDTCVEGMRKFTTEVFDTGVVMVAYLAMLLAYDVRLALISCLFPPIAFIIAERLKKPVSRCAAAYKESAGRLNGATLDRVSAAMTYRILGSEQQRNASYEEHLAEYERKAVSAEILETTLQPLYQILAMISVIPIIWMGAKNIAGTGWAAWNIAAFTTFLSCFAKLATKSSKAAKLFNAVQKASVSWKRIKPMLHKTAQDSDVEPQPAQPLSVQELSFAYGDGKQVLQQISFAAQPGQVIAVTGPVACGKSTLGSVFLGDLPYTGSIQIGGKELRSLSAAAQRGTVAYMGHDPELLSDTVEENVSLGDAMDIQPFLHVVCLDEEIAAMPEGTQTKVGSGGVRLSGGQQARLALARTLAHRKPILVLDDPFSALDRHTEDEVWTNLRPLIGDSIVLLFSHRLYLFPQADAVLWMKDGAVTVGTHDTLMSENPEYAALYAAQTGGDLDAQE